MYFINDKTMHAGKLDYLFLIRKNLDFHAGGYSSLKKTLQIKLSVTIDLLQVSCCHSNIRHFGVQPVLKPW